MNRPDYLRLLAMAFRDLHNCEAKHLETVPVVERFQGKIAWEGEVEVFALTSHPKASKGYAWAYEDGEESKVTAVLEIPPVISPLTAVQASIIALSKDSPKT